LEVACPECNELGCEHCKGTGYFLITDCPKKSIDIEVYKANRLSLLMQKGLPPISGGSLEQSAWFMNFFAFWDSEHNRAENEVYKSR